MADSPIRNCTESDKRISIPFDSLPYVRKSTSGEPKKVLLSDTILQKALSESESLSKVCKAKVKKRELYFFNPDILPKVVATLNPDKTTDKADSKDDPLTNLLFDIVIEGGRVVDPASKTDEKMNIGISGDRIVILSAAMIHGALTIDATGLMVSPGFIDSQTTVGNINNYRTVEKYKVLDGVTTVLHMHGGTDDAGKYYRKREKHYANHGVSTFVLRIRNLTSSYRPRSRFSKRKQMVQQNVKHGALGVSHSPEYQAISTEELQAYCQIAADYDVPCMLHLRYSSREQELGGIEEAIRIAKETGARVHILHLNSTGGSYNMRGALDMINRARNEGTKISASIYPYTFWATYSRSTRFDSGWKERYHLKSYKDLTVVGTGERLTRRKFNEYRKRMGVLLAVPPGTISKEDCIYPALKTPHIIISSDGGIEKEPYGKKNSNNHPRGAGNFSKALSMARELKMEPLEIINRMTALPAELIGKPLDDRGRLASGKRADVTIFDWENVTDRATVANPNQPSEGIKYVLVNGKIVVYQGKLKEDVFPGVTIRRTNPSSSK